MQKKSEKIIFTLYLLGFLALALTLALLQPLANTPPLYGNPPDEHARYLIPQFICKYGKIPTGWEEEVRIPAYGFSYALYNVFPYIVQGYLMRFVSLFTESEVVLLYTARLVNVTFGLLMAVVVYLIGKRVFRDDRFRWLFCFAVTYLPEGLFLHTYVNTDSCCMLSTAMMVYALVCVYQDGINLRNSLWMSGGIILCALSYYNAYGYIVSCILLFLLSFLQKKKNGGYFYDWKNMLKYGCLIAGDRLVVHPQLYRSGRRSAGTGHPGKDGDPICGGECQSADHADLSVHGLYGAGNVPGTLHTVRSVPQLRGSFRLHVHLRKHLAVSGV